MDKDKLVAALNKIQNGADVGGFSDELETLITLVVNASSVHLLRKCALTVGALLCATR